jgi:hypothetical protein
MLSIVKMFESIYTIPFNISGVRSIVTTTGSTGTGSRVLLCLPRIKSMYYYTVTFHYDSSIGGLAQLVERLLSMQEVADSISAFSNFCFFFSKPSKYPICNSINKSQSNTSTSTRYLTFSQYCIDHRSTRINTTKDG